MLPGIAFVFALFAAPALPQGDDAAEKPKETDYESSKYIAPSREKESSYRFDKEGNPLRGEDKKEEAKGKKKKPERAGSKKLTRKPGKRRPGQSKKEAPAPEDAAPGEASPEEPELDGEDGPQEEEPSEGFDYGAVSLDDGGTAGTVPSVGDGGSGEEDASMRSGGAVPERPPAGQ
ncbi:MAG: hypothetical protein ABII00_11485 [Elusimicrobiota bacterium]